MKETILIIGVRRNCYKAALKLGYDVLLWSDEPLSEKRKKGLTGWLESSYTDNAKELTDDVTDFLKDHKIDHVIANSEETVILGAHARKFLGLKEVGYKVAEKFHNKFVMKNTVKEIGVPITKYHLITPDTTADPLIEELGLPLVIKPVDESGAQDVKVAKTKDQVESYMEEGLLAEAFVEGREISVETFVKEGRPVFHNITDYLHQWKKSLLPATLNEDLKAQILQINDRVIEHFQLDRGMTHAEFYLTSKGPVFGEIAVRPPGGYYMELITEVYGFNSWETYVELSCKKEVNDLNAEPQGCGVVLMLHPGQGTIKEIRGEETVKKEVSGLIDFRLRKKAGGRVEEHTNTSNEVGHILFKEKDAKTALQCLDFIEKTLVFEMNPQSKS